MNLLTKTTAPTQPTPAALQRALLVALVLAMPAVHAEVFDKPPATTRTASMTREELRVCMRTETQLKQREDALDLDRAKHEKLLASSSDEAMDAAQRLRSINGGDQGALNDYNARNQARNLLVEQINESAERINARTAAMQADHANYLEQCASKRYLLKDKTALLKETGRATSASSGLLNIKPPAAAPAPATAPAADAPQSPAAQR